HSTNAPPALSRAPVSVRRSGGRRQEAAAGAPTRASAAGAISTTAGCGGGEPGPVLLAAAVLERCAERPLARAERAATEDRSVSTRTAASLPDATRHAAPGRRRGQEA